MLTKTPSWSPEGKFLLPALIGVAVFEASYDLTTFLMTLKSTRSFEKAFKTVIERSPILSNTIGTGVDVTMGPVAPVVQPFLDPTMADTLIKMKKHNKKAEGLCPEKQQ